MKKKINYCYHGIEMGCKFFESIALDKEFANKQSSPRSGEVLSEIRSSNLEQENQRDNANKEDMKKVCHCRAEVKV